MEDLFDDLFGWLDVFDRLQSWATFALSPVSKRAKHGRLDLVSIALPRGDKDGDKAVSEVVDYLRHFGVIVAYTSFDSQAIHIDVRRNQQRWVKYLMSNMDYARKNWKESAAAPKGYPKRQKAAGKRHQSRNWLDKIFG